MYTPICRCLPSSLILPDISKDSVTLGLGVLVDQQWEEEEVVVDTVSLRDALPLTLLTARRVTLHIVAPWN